VITTLLTWRRKQRRILAGVRPVRQKPPGADAPEDEPIYKPLTWPVMRKGLALLAPFKHRYALATAVGLLTTLLEMIAPQYIQHLVDHDLPQGAAYGPHFMGRGIVWVLRLFGGGAADAARGCFTAPTRQPYWNIGFTILLWAMTTAIAILLQRFWIRYARQTGETVIFGLRKTVFAHLQKLSMSFYDKTKFGRIYTRGTSDIDTLVGPVVNGVNTTVTLLATLLIASITMIVIDWRVALADDDHGD
jgi:ABC-type multidrug transport system fused ATPase/permease subunit